MKDIFLLKQEILEMIAATFSAIPIWDLHALQKIADLQIQASYSFRSLYLADMDANALIFAPQKTAQGNQTKTGINYQDRDYYIKLKQSKKTSLGAIKIGKQIKEPNLHIAVPIYKDTKLKDRGDLRGFITAGISPNLLGAIVERTLRHRDGYRGVLVDEQGRIASDSKKFKMTMTPLDQTDIMSQCPVYYRDFILNHVAYRGYCKKLNIPNLNWSLWITVPLDSISEESSKAKALIFKEWALIFCLTILLITMISQRIKKQTDIIQQTASNIMQNNMSFKMPTVHWYTPREISLVTHIARQTIDYFKESQRQALEKERTRRLFGQHVDTEVANKLLEKPIQAETKKVTVLFTDLRGFTTLSENVDANTLLHLLNQHFDTIVPIVHKFGGTLNKFIGDAVMATFGAPLDQEDHAHKACLAAIEMVQAMNQLNQQLSADQLPHLEMGVGISTGDVILGLMGTEKRKEYTVLGDTVNIASRLEGLNKKFSSSILISHNTYVAVHDMVKTKHMGTTPLKGKALPLEVYTIESE